MLHKLSDKLKEYKKNIQEKESLNKKEYIYIKKYLINLFNNKDIMDFVSDFDIKKDKVIIKTRNKIFSNELFLKKEELEKTFKKRLTIL